jgi:hypothetical protein
LVPLRHRRCSGSLNDGSGPTHDFGCVGAIKPMPVMRSGRAGDHRSLGTSAPPIRWLRHPFFSPNFAPRSVGGDIFFACVVKCTANLIMNIMHIAMATSCHGTNAAAATPTANPNKKTKSWDTLGILISSLDDVISGVDGVATSPHLQ